MLEIRTNFSDEYLIGHARRVGLAGENTAPDTLSRLLPTIRFDIVYESDRIRDAGFPNAFKIAESASPSENTPALAEFLDVSPEIAHQIAGTDYLFVD